MPLPIYLTSPLSLTRDMETPALAEPAPGACLPGSCLTQCDNCHTPDNCVPATRIYGELTLCTDCYTRRT